MNDDPFLNDGCTGWFDGTWGACCNAHDPAFLTGETIGDFLSANFQLLGCVWETNPLIAVVMFAGVMSPIGFIFFKRGKWGKKDKRT